MEKKSILKNIESIAFEIHICCESEINKYFCYKKTNKKKRIKKIEK